MLPILLLAASTVAWCVLEAAASTCEPHARLPRELATGLALFAVHVSAIVDYGLRDPQPIYAGLVLIALGIALRVWAIHTLGTAFVSPAVAPLRIVRSGPYRWLRHPSELGLLAAATGAAVLFASFVAAAIIALVLAPLSIMRCAAEDRGLAQPR
jgi:protein-S-isoprenylcysteine O-methyltransferase Ste14